MFFRIKQKLKWLLYSNGSFCGSKFRYYGVPLSFPTGSHTFARLCEQGIYEHGNIEVIKRLVRKESIYLDVGGNIGLMAIPILASQPSVKVVSYEPSPNTLPHLRKNQQASGFGSRWEIVGKGIADREGESLFYKFPPAAEAFDGFADTGRGGLAEVTSVPTTALDREWDRLGQADISVIKLDIEGSELKALKGGRACLLATRAHVVVELNRENLTANGEDASSVLAFAREIDYSVLALPSMLPMLNPGILDLHMHETESFLLVSEAGTTVPGN
jgi:FkbM family methyltransferase